MRLFIIIFFVGNILFGCSEQDRILPGKREDPASSFGFAAQDKITFTEKNDIKISDMQVNDEWRFVSSEVSKDYPNLMLGENLKEVWSVSIGKGDSKKKRLVTDPIFFNKKIFTLDVNSIASAFDAEGRLLWRKDLTPPGEKSGDIFGGGFTFGQDQLFVTLGYGFLLSLDPSTGEENWSQRLIGAGNNTPIFNDGLVFLVSGDSKVWAIDADKGRVKWTVDAIGNETNLISNNAPAVSDKYAVFGLGNGEIYVTFKRGGYVLWSSSLSSRNDSRVVSAIDDIVASPVILDRNVYSADGSGKVVSLKIESGERNWTAPYGSSGNFWIADRSLFFISDTNKLVRLEIKTGKTVWLTELPSLSQKRILQSKKNIQHYGPIIAGNQLIVVSSDGYFRFYDPETGEQKSKLKTKATATVNPIVVNETLYLITQDGKLRAFR
ncbi:MAG: PQQ-binding-like beta-propeller repeat protein [Paracoccaceae bacterium]|nr:PQQ-binding-like beta-propeller repeat protein [Paracoccaceae bacterium]